jgi:uncharacterized damage-inducible protein DinB
VADVATTEGRQHEMSMVEQARRMTRWNVWANGVVGDALRNSGGEPAGALAAYQHIFEAELAWLRRIAMEPRPNVALWGPASLEQAETWGQEARGRMAVLGASLDEQFLKSTFAYANSTGRVFTDRVEEVLLHLFLHSQQYRGEAAAFLNASGHRVADFDFIFWMRIGEPE